MQDLVAFVLGYSSMVDLSQAYEDRFTSSIFFFFFLVVFDSLNCGLEIGIKL